MQILKELTDRELMQFYWEAEESQSKLIKAIRKEFDRRIREQ